ncbi:translocation/assembly module TamB domain-containing protein [Paracoccus mutanolyticus]|nr:translocation/assembly module TamB domain-containing protein [Paracoccus mutanolyticus]
MDLTATAPGDTDARITGTAAANLQSMDIRVQGTSNAAAANPFLRTRSVEGPLSFDLRLNGRPSLQALSGRVALTNGRLAEPRFGLAVGSLNARADIADGRLTLDIQGAVENGGRISVTGPITLTGQRPMDLSVRLADVVLRDPNLYETRVNGAISVSGSQAGGPLVSGRIDLGRTESASPRPWAAPARFPTSGTCPNARPSARPAPRPG